MISISLMSAIILTALLMFTVMHRAKALMKFYQQEEYDSPRFFSWVRDNAAYDRLASLWFILGTVFIYGFDQPHLGSACLVPGFITAFYTSRRAINDAKKPLVMTERVKRILRVYGLVNIYLLVILYLLTNNYLTNFTLTALLLLQFTPLLIVVSKVLLDSNERQVQAHFKADADKCFAALNPRVIAITGSFGKTSTKHILHHILSSAQPTLATPGSVNTVMGITRVIREQLKPEHHFFIVEMGAYGPGSIETLAAFTPPEVGLITAVGAAHYERFKNLETVAKAKFELAENVTARGGKMVVNSDGIAKELLDERLSAVPGDYLIVGKGHKVHLKQSRMSADGTHLTIVDEGGGEQDLLVPLFGQHQAENTLLAVATARSLGMPWSIIRAAMRTMPQIKHRVEVSKISGQPITINDAYNSNPIGFAAALDVLDVLKREGGRRILLTPGMVELGETHDSEHAKLGALAAEKADIVLAVTPERIESFTEAVEQAQLAELHLFDTQDEAQAWLNAHITALDVVLFENNLPDLYEAKVQF